MSDAFTDVAKMKKIKEDIVEYTNDNVPAGDSASTYVESYTYSDILTEKNLIRYFDDESEEQ